MDVDNNSLATLACLQNDFKAVLEKCSKIDNIVEDLNNLKSAVEKRNPRRIIVSDSSASESDTPILTQQTMILITMMTVMTV